MEMTIRSTGRKQGDTDRRAACSNERMLDLRLVWLKDKRISQQTPRPGVTFALAVMAMGFPNSAWSDPPIVTCEYSSKPIVAELKLTGAGEGSLAGEIDETAFECQLVLSGIKDCRRCASTVNYILTFDRQACQITRPNASVDELSSRISLHIFRTHAEIGLLGGMPRDYCRTYSFDEGLLPLIDGGR